MRLLTQVTTLAMVSAGLATVMVTAPAGAQPNGERSLIQQLRDEARGSVTITHEKATGKVGFVTVGRNGDLLPTSSARARGKSDAFLAKYARVFGAPADQLVEQATDKDPHGTTVTYTQEYKGLPVFAAMLRAHLDNQGDLTAVNGSTVPDLNLSVTPRLTAADAASRAVETVKADPPSSQDGRRSDTSGLKAASTELLVYREGLIRGVQGDDVLAYRVEVTNRSNIRDIVFVSAASGKPVNRYSMIDDALERELYETSPDTTPVWKEGDPFPGTLNDQQQNLVKSTGESYWFYDNTFGRDSYDGAGATMKTVNNDPRINCPNANWNGVTTNYCNGVTSDDVVSHEWGHAYTEYTHGLIYQWQPGALNESYSDIWGETIDLINGRMDEDEGDITAKRQDGACSTHSPATPIVKINSPSSIAKTCQTAGAQFGPQLDSAGITADVVQAQDAAGTPSGSTAYDGCTALTNAADVAGKIALIDRGSCAFTVKAKNAQDAGATGVIVGNTVDAVNSMSGSDPTITIPTVMIPKSDRDLIVGTLATQPVNATMRDAASARGDSYRWLMGEDSFAFGGAIRDMWSPTCYGDPGKVSDAQYYCAPDDGGGVHSNSGVPNHGYALLVDGGSYNGVTVPALGLTKAAHIYYRAMTNYQTPTTDFTDHADSLEASCTDLVGQPLNKLSVAPHDSGVSGVVISASDCAAVSAMAQAVELRKEPTQCNFRPLLDPNTPDLCASNEKRNVVWKDDFEAGMANWTLSSKAVYPGGKTYDWSADSTLPGGRSGSAAFGPAPDEGDCSASAADISGVSSMTSVPIELPGAGQKAPRLTFDHYVATEAGYDGGNLKISVNGGAFSLVPSDAFVFNPYNTTMAAAPGNTSPLAGEAGFSGTDGGKTSGSWGQSQVDLSMIGAKPGDTVVLRFDIGRDGCGGVEGWYVDDVTVSTCKPATKGKPLAIKEG